MTGSLLEPALTGRMVILSTARRGDAALVDIGLAEALLECLKAALDGGIAA
jgi:hypothetical protein